MIYGTKKHDIMHNHHRYKFRKLNLEPSDTWTRTSNRMQYSGLERQLSPRGNADLSMICFTKSYGTDCSCRDMIGSEVGQPTSMVMEIGSRFGEVKGNAIGKHREPSPNPWYKHSLEIVDSNETTIYNQIKRLCSHALLLYSYQGFKEEFMKKEKKKERK